MRFLSALLASIVVLALAAAGCMTGPSFDASENLSAGESSGTLVLYTEELPPFNYIDRRGNLAGTSVEIVREIAERTNTPITITLLPWSDAYETTLKRSNAGLFSTARIQSRERLFSWVGPIGEFEYGFYGLKGAESRVDSLDDASKAGLIAVVRSDSRYEFLLRNNVTNLLPCESDRECIEAVRSGRAALWLGITDTYAQTSLELSRHLDELVLIWPFRMAGLYIAFGRGTPTATIDSWQAALEAMRADGTYDTIQTHEMPYICSWIGCRP